MRTRRTARSDFRQRVESLAGQGHRGSATPGEAAAADYLTGVLEAMGLRAGREEFRGSSTMGVRLLVPVFVAAVGLGLAWASGVAALSLLGAVGLAALVHEQMTGRAWLTRPVTRSPSANVLATVPPKGRTRRRLVLCAHYDSQRAGLIWNRFTMVHVAPLIARLPGPMKTPLFVLTVAMVVQCSLPVLAPAASGPLASACHWAVAVVYALSILLLGEWAAGRFVPGASDNATGVAAVLEVARRWLLAEPAEGVELVVLLSGCEETGLLGAAAWCDRHRDEIANVPTRFLNIDSVGFGPPRFLGRDTPMAGWPLRYPRTMVEVARRAAGDGEWRDAGPHALPGPTDGLAFLARGVPGVTVVGFRGPGIMEYYHQPSDTVERPGERPPVHDPDPHLLRDRPVDPAAGLGQCVPGPRQQKRVPPEHAPQLRRLDRQFGPVADLRDPPA
jgi:hypothetical protein